VSVTAEAMTAERSDGRRKNAGHIKPGEVRNPTGKSGPRQTTLILQHAITEVFDKAGGVPWMLRWAKKHPTEFFKLAGRLIPQQIQASVSVDPGFADQLARAMKRGGEPQTLPAVSVRDVTDAVVDALPAPEGDHAEGR